MDIGWQNSKGIVMYIDESYYEGFEGEPEIIFYLELQGEYLKKFGVWDGYFDEIIEKIEFGEKGWEGLAYYYHLFIGWYEESPWLIPNLQEAYEQIINIDIKKFNEKEEKDIIIKIARLMEEAIERKGNVYISYDE